MAVSESHPEVAALAPAQERPRRADAARNRERLLEAASALFRERGLEVAVSEIAERAGIGRATLFRNFPTKRDLVVAIVIERMAEAVRLGRELLAAGEPRGGLVMSLIEPLVEGQRLDRALFEGVGADNLFTLPEIQAAHAEMLELFDALLAADQAAGTIRTDVCALDVLMLMKGICKVTGDLPADAAAVMVARQVALMRSALSAEAAVNCALPPERVGLAALRAGSGC